MDKKIFVIDHTGDKKKCCKCANTGNAIMFFKNRWYCAQCKPADILANKKEHKKERAKRVNRDELRNFIVRKFKELRIIEIQLLVKEACEKDLAESKGAVHAIIFSLKKEGKIKPLSRGIYVLNSTR